MRFWKIGALMEDARLLLPLLYRVASTRLTSQSIDRENRRNQLRASPARPLRAPPAAAQANRQRTEMRKMQVDERLAIVGSGAIAYGLAATAAHHGGGWGPVLLLARSEDSANRARASVEQTLGRLGAHVDPGHVQIVTDPQALAQATFVVEAVVEDPEI